MIIRHMQGTFGTLDGEQLRLDTGLNIIYAPNESGKSTWCAFLRAMLYGIDTSQRARAGFVPDKQKYAPWSGKPMAGELELEQGGKCITIRRWTEAPNAPLRGFSAVYTGTDIPVPGLTAADAGEQLTGVSAEVFARTAFIGQGGLVVTGTPELERRISAIVTSGEEASSYTEADAQLRAWLRRRRSGQHGALPELEGRITEVEEQLHRLERNAQEQAACAAEIAQTDAELQTVTEQMNAARQRQRRAALSSMGEEKSNLRTLEQTLEQARRDAAARRTALEQTHFGVQTPDEAGETAERDAQRAESLAGTAEHGGKPYFWIAALVLAALCAALGYLVAQPLYYAAIALAVLAVVLLIVARSGKKRAQQASAALGKLLRSYGAQAQVGRVRATARLGQCDGEQGLALGELFQPGLDHFRAAVLGQDLAVQRGQQVDVGQAQIGAGDLFVDHAGGQAAQALTAKALGQFGRDEAHLAHLAHQAAVEHAGLVARQKAGRHAPVGKAARVFGQRLQVFIDVGVVHRGAPGLIWRTCGTRACAFPAGLSPLRATLRCRSTA